MSDELDGGMTSRAEAWETVFDLCKRLGMNSRSGSGLSNVTEFIEGLVPMNRRPVATDGPQCDPPMSPREHLADVSFSGLGQIVKNIHQIMPELLDGDPDKLGRMVCCIAECHRT